MKINSKTATTLLVLICTLAFSAHTLAQSTFQAANAHIAFTDIDVPGAGTLTRDEDGVEVRLTLAGLYKKSSYSVWWIVFNDPASCQHGGPGVCGPTDIDAVANAGGFLTGTDGTANMTGELEVGPLPQGLAGFGELTDAFGAEIHLIIQSHGKHNVGSVDAQISIPGAACKGNRCGDHYAIAFLANPPAP